MYISRPGILSRTLVIWLVQTASVALAQAPPAHKLPPPATPADSLRRAFYAYDATLPLNAEVKQLETTAYGVRYHLVYDSANDQRVTAARQ